MADSTSAVLRWSARSETVGTPRGRFSVLPGLGNPKRTPKALWPLPCRFCPLSDTPRGCPARAITWGAVDIVQSDIAWSGGFSESRRIAALAHAHHRMVAPHAFASVVTLVASLH